MRKIFIWDIHGCFDEFQELLWLLDIQSSDKIYIAWDMVNRGPKSFEVLEYLYNNQDQFHAIKWNHEVGLIAHLDWLAPKYENEQYILLRKQLRDNINVWNYVRDLPLYIDEEDFLLVHAWVLPWIDIKNQGEKTLTEIYYYQDLPWYMYYPVHDKTIIYGHWAENGLQIRSNTIWLDSGCCIWNKLSAYIFGSWEILQVPAKRQYLTPKLVWHEAERAKK